MSLTSIDHTHSCTADPSWCRRQPSAAAACACSHHWPRCTFTQRRQRRQPPPTAAQQDEFFISFWVGPQVNVEDLDGRFAEIAEANFTGYLGFNGNSHTSYAPNPERVAAEIKLCDKHGLKCVPSLCTPTTVGSPCLNSTNATKSSHFWGWQLQDEPGSVLAIRCHAQRTVSLV